MNFDEFRSSLTQHSPPGNLSAPLVALWWDARGEWARAHELVDELETREGMAVHAYLHRKEGSEGNANYWYDRAGRTYCRSDLNDEWTALAQLLLAATVD